VQDFTKLRCWSDAQELAVAVHVLTAGFPQDERFGLISQMRRASISVSSNIAEGCGRRGPGELSQFLQIAIGSCCELSSQVVISRRLGYLSEEETLNIGDAAEKTRRSLIKLQASVDHRRSGA
jgi:four helix bundle protein